MKHLNCMQCMQFPMQNMQTYAEILHSLHRIFAYFLCKNLQMFAYPLHIGNEYAKMYAKIVNVCNHCKNCRCLHKSKYLHRNSYAIYANCMQIFKSRYLHTKYMQSMQKLYAIIVKIPMQYMQIVCKYLQERK